MVGVVEVQGDGDFLHRHGRLCQQSPGALKPPGEVVLVRGNPRLPLEQLAEVVIADAQRAGQFAQVEHLLNSLLKNSPGLFDKRMGCSTFGWLGSEG